MTLNVQLVTMVSMVLGGFYLGVAYDTFERFAHLWRKKRLLSYGIAIVFWVVQASIIFYLLYRANFGELRIYVFLACLLGLSIYQVIASRLYKRLLNGLIAVIKGFFKIVSTIIRLVILRPIQLLIRIIFLLLNFIKEMVLTLIRFLFSLIKGIGKGLLRLIPEKIKKSVYKNPPFCSIIDNIYRKLRKFFPF